ncbi:hypothetical protein NEOLEDRAFT_1246306 [Neolentinus lepideus HHB14362 ss-1]|uniref:Uncharacterized protein n=1 Tax=Neolentinus lepideus HHB14362 ss-1 TaxID=1314782 RepID=A0A165MRW2_9AGAM|nr:hypothetical protein NEOLEDRAFT_1246306 [Neolentinus lepideus HHB14362 ss-1]
MPEARPAKRLKLEHTRASTSKEQPFKPLPLPILLLSLPALLVQPPTSRFHAQALCLSLAAVRACLGLGALSPEVECRAWTALAEVGMGVVAGGFCGREGCEWASGVESEVEKAIAKGTLIAQKHPSLSLYLHHLTFLHARLAAWKQNPKFSRKLISRLTSSFLPSDPPHIVYAAHLARIESFIASSVPGEVNAGLGNIEALENLARLNGRGHERVVLLCRVLRLRALVKAEMWDAVGEALRLVEEDLGVRYEVAGTPKSQNFAQFGEPFETAMAVHALVIGITFFTHAGNAAEASPRLSHLHVLLDSGALDRFAAGVVEIPFENSLPLTVQVTHPRILYMLTFLVSAVAKRDVVGRKPKRKVFASEGIAAWEREAGKEVVLPPWASVGDVEEVQQRMARIKADLLCELAAVGVMRSEFEEAQHNLDTLIAHTRTHDIFELFAARIALQQGHLAHARGQAERAGRCYRAAAFLAGAGDEFVEIAARAGELVLGIGVHGREEGVGAEEGEALARQCRGRGAALEAVGQVVEACLATEILKSKQHLKNALSLASRAQDNYLRALLLALISAHYMHTSPEHAKGMLETCEQLAMGLGAPVQKLGGVGVNGKMGKTRVEVVSVGNVPLRLWCGERFVEIARREGEEGEVKKREGVNKLLVKSLKS